jgi:hypothetical protein
MELIKIYKLGEEPIGGGNREKIHEVLIEVNDRVILEPHTWDEDNPHIKIYLQNNFEFFKRFNIKECDCRVLHNDFGSDESWYIEYDGQGYSLDLRSFNGREYNHNNCVSAHGYYENGTILKFKVFLEY